MREGTLTRLIKRAHGSQLPGDSSHTRSHRRCGQAGLGCRGPLGPAPQATDSQCTLSRLAEHNSSTLGAAEVGADTTAEPQDRVSPGSASEAAIQTSPAQLASLPWAQLKRLPFPFPKTEEPGTDSPGPAALSQGWFSGVICPLTAGKEEVKGQPAKAYFKDAVENKGFRAPDWRVVLRSYNRKAIQVPPHPLSCQC